MPGTDKKNFSPVPVCVQRRGKICFPGEGKNFFCRRGLLMQIGIRLHDVNAQGTTADKTLEARAAKARQEGFSCVHLALAKCVEGVTFDHA